MLGAKRGSLKLVKLLILRQLEPARTLEGAANVKLLHELDAVSPSFATK